jgi:hypothetical protein
MFKMGSHDPFRYLKHKLWLKKKLKTLDKSYNFASDLTSIKGLHTKLWASKVTKVPILIISKLLLGIFKTKWHLGANPMAKHKIYYKGEGDESYGSVFARNSFMHQKCSSYALTNSLFGLCRSVWVIDLFVTHSSPYPKTPTCPSTPKVLWIRERAPTPYPSIGFIFKFAIECTKEFGVHHQVMKFW